MGSLQTRFFNWNSVTVQDKLRWRTNNRNCNLTSSPRYSIEKQFSCTFPNTAVSTKVFHQEINVISAIAKTIYLVTLFRCFKNEMPKSICEIYDLPSAPGPILLKTDVWRNPVFPVGLRYTLKLSNFSNLYCLFVQKSVVAGWIKQQTSPLMLSQGTE